MGESSGACPHPDTIDGIALELLSHTVFQSPRQTQKQDQHKDSPTNTETCQETPEWVLRDGRKNFLPFIQIKHSGEWWKEWMNKGQGLGLNDLLFTFDDSISESDNTIRHIGDIIFMRYNDDGYSTLIYLFK